MIKSLNQRQKSLLLLAILGLLLIFVVIGSFTINPVGLSSNLSITNLSPSLDHPFGTDWLGRDMLTRTLIGLRRSITIGFITAAITTVISTIFALMAGLGDKRLDNFVLWLVNIFMSIPALLAAMIISLLAGRGAFGVVLAVSLTHWSSYTRILRSHVISLNNQPYIQLSRSYGKSNFWIANHHVLPHLLSELLISFLSIFSHAIVMESSLSFLGFGFSPHTPSIGIILSESLSYLTKGLWWLGIYPGLSLFIIVLMIYLVGDHLRKNLAPETAHL